uniref:Bifunctional inhibitor/plant lipid transfer protein/seed storage helical domain-containing protein n=2 Tax=Zea mays TaxID=4577 RepID=A0A804RLG3_MAIZE
MECRLHHLALLLGLLVWAAAAATGGGAQPVCEPSIIATQIALFCMPDMPTAPCCEPIIASIDLGGGVPCLCRVAAQPQLVLARLNATHHLALYASCGGQHTMGAHLAAACQQAPSPPATVLVLAPPPPQAANTRDDPSPAAAEQEAVPYRGHRRRPRPGQPHASPAAAPTMPPPPPPHSGSDKGCVVVVSAALELVFFVMAGIVFVLE